MASKMQRPPAVANLMGRERDTAFEAEREFEPTIKDAFLAISAMTKQIVVRDGIKAEVAEALQLVAERLLDVEESVAKLRAQSNNLHTRVAAVEPGTATIHDRVLEAERHHIIEHHRVCNLETELSEIKKRLAALNVKTSPSSRGFRADDTDARKCIAFMGFAQEESADVRCCNLKAFMAAHFAGVKY